MFNRRFACFVFFALLLSSPVNAAQFETFGDYVVHYNAINTGMLTPEVAQHYKILRSKNRALLNISVRKKGSESVMTDSAVTATVEVTITNLSGQLETVNMKEIREGDAIYYIGVFRIDNEEIFNFNIQVTPESKGQTRVVKFRQQFFVE